MTKKNGLLILVVLVMAGIYVVYFTDWFKPKIIHIVSTNQRATRTAAARANSNPGFIQRLATLASASANADAPTLQVIFKMSKPYKLTDLKVVDLSQWQTNKSCLPLWHLVADTNSVPVDRPFNYGQRIPGMKPQVQGGRPQPLNPGVKYRLFVTDGSAEGAHDFTPVAKPAEASP
jgi:hypothetical protein